MSLLSGIHRREGLTLLLLLVMVCAGTVLGKPLKFDRDKRVGFALMIPEQVGGWQRISIKDSQDLPGALDINELYQALYSHPTHGLLALTLEYTSDSRRQFELHYPDICHTVRGDEITQHPPARFEMTDGRFLEYANMHWQQGNNGHSALAAYWYVTREGTTIDSMDLKVRQALAGLFTRPEEAVMVRFDAFHEKNAKRSHQQLLVAINDFNNQLEAGVDPQARELLYRTIVKEDI